MSLKLGTSGEAYDLGLRANLATSLCVRDFLRHQQKFAYFYALRERGREQCLFIYQAGYLLPRLESSIVCLGGDWEIKVRRESSPIVSHALIRSQRVSSVHVTERCREYALLFQQDIVECIYLYFISDPDEKPLEKRQQTALFPNKRRLVRDPLPQKA